jgi:hypothetical protein
MGAPAAPRRPALQPPAAHSTRIALQPATPSDTGWVIENRPIQHKGGMAVSFPSMSLLESAGTLDRRVACQEILAPRWRWQDRIDPACCRPPRKDAGVGISNNSSAGSDCQERHEGPNSIPPTCNRAAASGIRESRQLRSVHVWGDAGSLILTTEPCVKSWMGSDRAPVFAT